MVSFFDKSHSNTLKLGEGDQRLLTLSDNENVGHTSGEVVASGILDVDDLVGTWMVLNVHELSNTTDIVSSLDEHGGSVLEFDNLLNITGLEVQLISESIKYEIEEKLVKGTSFRGENDRGLPGWCRSS